jgi:hypothetical protein
MPACAVRDRRDGCASRLVFLGGVFGALAASLTAGCTSDVGPLNQRTSGTDASYSVETSTQPDVSSPTGGDDGATANADSTSNSAMPDGRDSLGDAAGNATEAAGNADGNAASPDATISDSATANCITSGTELCEDFESGQIDPKIWKILLGGPAPSVTVDGLHTHSGKYAAHAHVTPGQQSTAQLTEGVTFPAMADAFYTRIWAYFSPAVMWPSNPPDFHMGLIIAGGKNNFGHVELAVGANLSPSSSAGPMHYLGYSIYRGPPYVEFGPRSNTAIANLAWTCIELLESGQGGQAAVRRIWVDGTELPEQNNSFSGQKPPQFDLVSIGIWEYHPTPTLSDMWIDDIRVSSQRVGCVP